MGNDKDQYQENYIHNLFNLQNTTTSVQALCLLKKPLYCA